MNYIFLKEYINKITKDKLKDISLKYNIFLNNNELNILYTYIKEKYLDFIKNPDTIIEEIKPQITQENYIKLLYIFNQYKDKIRAYFP